VTWTIADTRGLRPDDGVVSSSDGPRSDQSRRRVFTPEFKLKMVAEYDRAEPGERGALLRRERLYHSHVIEWRKARDAGTLVARQAAGLSTKRWNWGFSQSRAAESRPSKATSKALRAALHRMVHRHRPRP
jgi:transposase-like protein